MFRTWCLIVFAMFATFQVAQANQLKIFLRYDDYSRSSPADVEQVLFDTAKSVGSGVLVGVIPFPDSPYPAPDSGRMRLVAGLNEAKVATLIKNASDGAIEVAVHGFSHRNNATQGPNSEFTGLPESTQTQLLGIAKASLEAATGLNVKAFIPPFNGYDSETLTALEKSGYTLLSAGLGGPAHRDSNLRFLPGGPYPYRLKSVVLSALSNNHTDALVIATIHPYDIIESGRALPDFRHGSQQISLKKLQEDIQAIKQLQNVQFLSISELFQGGEDLTQERFHANNKLKDSFVSRHRLIPYALGAYPLTGLYYSKDSAQDMYALQLKAFLVQYGTLFLVVTLVMKVTIRHFFRQKKIFASVAGTISAAVALVVITKSLSSGFYMTSALAATCCLGVFVGAVLSHWQSGRYGSLATQ